jgi:heptosyltransferase-2
LIFPGGARNLMRDNPLRRWPLRHYGALARLAADAGWRVWLGGSAGDVWVRGEFEGLPHVDLLGRTDLPQTLALCARADAVVTHDSGPSHLAQASGSRVLTLFGPTLPSNFMDPAAPARALWGGVGLACRPCYDGLDFAACPDNVCLSSLTPGDVLAALEG